MSKWNRVLLCGSLCLVLGAGVFACKKDEEAEDYGDNDAAATTELTTEAAPSTEMGTAMSTEMSTDMSTDMSTGTH
ncbi:MAG TPA: hypothetical protein VFS60_12625 [Thermoanaerobaculia bacterium]|nr:hypothetical protein [Thermoanaerobaculia bacterium]